MINGITESWFGDLEIKTVTAYTITNANGVQVTVINYGATITRIITPDKNGTAGNVIIGFDSLEGYLQNGHQYFGAIIGRYCNRIANAHFSLDGKEYYLAANDKTSSLHGGWKGFDKVYWHIEKQDENSLKLTWLSKDGEEGYPGNLHIELTYTLNNNNELIMDYSAHTDKATPVNLTSHCYFNLSAGKDPTILDHELTIFADQYTTGFNETVTAAPIVSLKNTPLDFRVSKKIRKDIDKLPDGYDHNMVLNNPGGKAAVLYDPDSGRLMEVFTSEPGLQFYSGNFLGMTVTNGTDQSKYMKHAALCLEAQHYPDSPNETSFPNTILRPGEIYRQTTVYKFSVK
ncbi:MAG: aldose epimerase family protein [Ferruginibacter sp.]